MFLYFYVQERGNLDISSMFCGIQNLFNVFNMSYGIYFRLVYGHIFVLFNGGDI
jgi:hypothetical protein